VDSVDAIRERVIAADGRILMDKTTIPNVGHLLAFEDPGGNPVLAMEYDRPAA
jgi:predicted enzyme related to lactoylglutathione lyase